MAEVRLIVNVDKAQLEALKAEVDALDNRVITLKTGSGGSSAASGFSAVSKEATAAVNAQARYLNATNAVYLADQKTTQAAYRYATQIEKTATAQAKLAAEQEKSARKPSLLSTFLGGLKGAAINAAINTVTTSLKDGLQTMQAVDKEITNIRKVSNMSVQESSKLVDRAYDTAKKYAVSTQDYLSVVYDMQKAGLGESAEAMGELAVRASLVGDMGTDMASKFLIATNAAWDMGGSFEELSLAVDKADYINNNFATDLQKLTQGMPIVASTAANMGVSFEETLAALGTITSKTQETGSKAATALRALFMNISGELGTLYDEDGEKIEVTEAGVKSITDAVKQYGSESTKAAIAAGKMIDPMEAIKDLAKAYQDGLLTDQELNQIMMDVGGKTRTNQLTALVKDLASQNSIFREMMAGMENAEGTAQNEVNIMLDSWEAKVTNLKTSWADLMTSVVDTDFIKGGVDALESVVSGVDALIEKANEGAGALGKLFNGGLEDGKGFKDTGFGQFLSMLLDFEFAGNPGLKIIKDAVFGEPFKDIKGLFDSLESWATGENVSKTQFDETTGKIKELNGQIAENQKLIKAAEKLPGDNSAYINGKREENRLLQEQQERLVGIQEEQAKGAAEFATKNLTDSILTETKALIERRKAGENVDEQLKSNIETIQDAKNTLDAIHNAGDTSAENMQKQAKALGLTLDEYKELIDSADISLTKDQEKKRGEAKSVLDEYEKLTDAIEKTDAAAKEALGETTPESAEKASESISELKSTYQSIMEEFQKNGDSQAFKDAVSGLLDADTIAAFGGDYKAIGEALSSEFWEGMFTNYPSEDFGDSFLSALYDIADEAGNVTNANGELIASLENVGGQLTLTGQDATALAEYLGVPREALYSMLAETSELSDMSRTELLNIAEGFDAVSESAGDAAEVDLSRLFEGMAEAGASDVDLWSMFDALKEMEGIDLANLPENMLDFIDTLVEARDTAKEVSEESGEIEITANTEGVSESIDAAKAEADGATAEMDVTANTSEAESQIDAAAESADGKKATIDVDADTSAAQAEISEAASAAEGQTATVTVEGDSSGAEEAANQAEEAVSGVDGMSATVTINGDASGALAAVEQARSALASVDGMSATVTVTANYVENHSGGGGARNEAKAAGTDSARGGVTLVNEEGPEIIREGDTARIAGGGKPAMTYVEPGAQIFNAGETQDILDGKRPDIRLRAAAGGFRSNTYGGTGNYLGSSAGASAGAASSASSGGGGGYSGGGASSGSGYSGGGSYNELKAAAMADGIGSAADIARALAAASETFEKTMDGYDRMAKLNAQMGVIGVSNKSGAEQLEDMIKLRESELELMQERGDSEKDQLDKMREIQEVIKNEITYMQESAAMRELTVEEQIKLNELEKTWWEYQKKFDEDKSKVWADTISVRKSELALMEEAGKAEETRLEDLRKSEEKLREQEQTLIRTQEYMAGDAETVAKVNELHRERLKVQSEIFNQIGKGQDAQIAKIREIQDGLHQEAEALRASQAYLDGDADTIAKINGLSEEWWKYQNQIVEMEHETAEALEAEILSRQKELMENFEKLSSLQKTALSFLQAAGADSEVLAKKYGDIGDALVNQLEYMEATGAEQEDMLSVAEDYLSNREAQRDLQVKLLQGEKELTKEEERKRGFLGSVVSLRKSELKLMQARGDEEADLVAKQREIQDAIKAEGEYMASIGGSQEEINALAAEWYEIEAEILEQQKALNEELTRAQTVQLDYLEDVVSLRENELNLMEARREADADIIDKHRQIQDALKAEAEFLMQTDAYLNRDAETLEKVNDLAQRWWKYQEATLKAQQSQLDELTSQAKETLDLEENARLKILNAELDSIKSQWEARKEDRTEAEKLLAVEKARAALENTRKQRTVRQYNSASGQWEWVASAKEVASAREALDKANDSLNEYYAEKEYKLAVSLLLLQIDYTEEAFDALRDSLDYVAKKIKAGEMTYQEAYAYIGDKMRGVYDDYNVELRELMTGTTTNITGLVGQAIAAISGAVDTGTGDITTAMQQAAEEMGFTVSGATLDMEEIIARAGEGLGGTIDGLSGTIDLANVDLGRIFDRMTVDLDGLMNQAVDGMEGVSGEIWDTWQAFKDVKGQIGDTVSGFGRIYNELGKSIEDADDLHQQLSMAALTFGDVNKDLSDAERYLWDTADELGELPDVIRRLLDRFTDTAGKGGYAGSDIIEEDWRGGDEAAYNLMRQRALQWWGTTDPAQLQALVEANERDGARLGLTMRQTNGARVWYDRNGNVAFSLTDAEKRQVVIEAMRQNSAKWHSTPTETGKQALEASNKELGARMGWTRGSDGVWYENGKRVFDEGGVLRGTGGIKATEQDEMVLNPDATEAVLSEPQKPREYIEAAENLEALYSQILKVPDVSGMTGSLRSMGIVAGSMAAPGVSFGAGAQNRYGDQIGTQINADGHVWNLTPQQADVMTLSQFRQFVNGAKNLPLYSGR